MVFITLTLVLLGAGPEGVFEEGHIFPASPMKCHSSSVVETPDGDLLACWYYGVGERKDDTLIIRGARKRKGQTVWDTPFLMADSQDLPDCNPMMFIDPANKLWLFWVAVQDNEWGAALLKYRTSTDYSGPGAPRWDWQEVAHCRPRNFEEQWFAFADAHKQEMDYYEETAAPARTKLARRLGWMTRAQPIMLSEKRMLVGLYSDVFHCSLAMATEDSGTTWQFSDPILGIGCIQPAFALKKNGDVVAYMRDYSPAHRIQTAVSKDGGVTWSEATLMDIPNPGSSVECITLANGNWLLVCNDPESGKERNQLTVYLSDDEGATWKWRRSLETDAMQASYPSVIQAKDGTMYCTYTYYLGRNAEGRKMRTIKWVRFDEAWVKAGAGK